MLIYDIVCSELHSIIEMKQKKEKKYVSIRLQLVAFCF